MTQQVAPMDQDPFDGSRMGLLDHLGELRNRMIWIVGALLFGIVASIAFVEPAIAFITAPVPVPLIAIGPTDTIFVFFKVMFVMGVVVAMPVLIYQIVAFIAPGLYPHEKRTLLMLLPGFMLLFFGGAAFANFVMLPVAVGFLQNFLGSVIDQEWTIDRYVGFFTRIVFWIGVSFETPLVIAFLARIGLVSGPRLLRMWRQGNRHCLGRGGYDYAHHRPCQHDDCHGAAHLPLFPRRRAGLRALQAESAAQLRRDGLGR